MISESFISANDRAAHPRGRDPVTERFCVPEPDICVCIGAGELTATVSMAESPSDVPSDQSAAGPDKRTGHGALRTS
jgi:hypothetical protein